MNVVRFRRGAVVVAGLLLGGALVTGVASAGPPGPANFGVMEASGIAGSGCPWPDAANSYMQNVEGVQKCLPQAIPWSAEVTEFGPQAGVRIVSDRLAPAVAGSGAAGQFTFWCQSRVGLHYQLTVQGLAPNTTYSATGVALAPGSPTSFGTFRTDPRGNGITAGVIGLPKGGYAVMVFVSSGGVPALVPDPADAVIGFSVL